MANKFNGADYPGAIDATVGGQYIPPRIEGDPRSANMPHPGVSRILTQVLKEKGYGLLGALREIWREEGRYPEQPLSALLEEMRPPAYTLDLPAAYRELYMRHHLTGIAYSLFRSECSVNDETQEVALEDQKYPSIVRLRQRLNETGQSMAEYAHATYTWLKQQQLQWFDDSHPAPPAADVADFVAHLERVEPRVQRFEEFLEEVADGFYPLAPYPTVNFGQEETRAIFAQWFRGCGIPASLSDTLAVNGGFKAVYGALVPLLLGEKGGTYLVPEGYYHTLSKMIGGSGGKLQILPQLDAEHVREALAKGGVRALVITPANNPDGYIHSREELEALARVILEHNRDHPQEPVYAIWDGAYQYAHLHKETEMPALGAIEIEGLGRMHEWTISAGTTSKTYAFATARVAPVTCGNPELFGRLKARLNEHVNYHAPVMTEIATAAAYALTPTQWIEQNNARNLEYVRQAQRWVHYINARWCEAMQTDQPILEVNDPAGGWYAVVGVRLDALPEPIRDILCADGFSPSELLQNYFLHYRFGAPETAVAAVAGKEVGYEALPHEENVAKFRLTLAFPPAEIDEMFDRIEVALAMLTMMSPQQLKDRLALGLSKEELARLPDIPLALDFAGLTQSMGERWEDPSIEALFEEQRTGGRQRESAPA